jgi:tetratricopeptide (TPR) repeat protein
VEVLAVYPHAHYLSKRMEGWAVLPSGRRRDLLRIDDWDFNFQDQYRYRRPIQLPAGSLISMRITFDNSAGNPHNPYDPPRRVVRGLASTDEMAQMGFQVLPSTPVDLAALESSLDRFYYEAELRWEADEHLAHARGLESEGRLDEALERYRGALLMGDDPRIMASMAELLLHKGDAGAAVLVTQRAAAVADGADPRILWMLARAYAAAGEMESARDAAKRAWEVADRLGARALADSLLAVRRSLGGGPT